MSEEQDIPQISMANTKKEMLAAYKEMRTMLEAKSQAEAPPSPQVAREEAKEQQAIAEAEELVVADVPQRIQDLRLTIGRELSELGARLESETRDYQRVKQAVAAKQAELQRVFEVETAAVDLAALIAAQRQRKEAFDADLAAGRESWEQEQRERREGQAAEEEDRDRRRKREQDEFEYALKRDRERRKNALEDELADLERHAQSAKEQAARERQQREAEFAAREEALARREAQLDELEQRIAAHPQELERAVEEAVAATETRLESAFASREAILTKESEGERNVLSSRIGSLEQLVESQAAQIETLSRQQEMAYEKLQDIASKAVESARGGAMNPPPAVIGPRPTRQEESDR
jgi:hypothetical protein